MKGAFFVLVALLAGLSLAAPPGSARRDIESSTSVHFTAQTTHGHLAKLSNLTAWISLNGTTSGTNAANLGKYGVALRMGPDRQHVGTLRGQRLYNAIFNCLNHLHPWDVDNYCSGETDGAGGLPVCEWSTCRINNIVYDDNLHGTPKYVGGNAYLEMKMWWPHVREKRNAKADRDLRKLTYEIIAGSYRKITEQDANCYLVHFPGSRATKFCMIPKQFLVAFPTTSGVGNVRNAVKIDIAFNGKSEGGNWDCPSSVEHVNGEFLYRFRGPLAKLLGWDEHEINPEAMCATDDCLDWYDADPDGPWKEDPKCKLPDFKIHD